MEKGLIYALIASFFWGANPILVKRGLVHSNVSSASLVQQTAIMLTLVMAAWLGDELQPAALSWRVVGLLIATGFVGAYLGRTLFVWSVDRVGAAKSQALVNSSPLVTVLLAIVFLGEAISWQICLGALLISTGIIFISRADGEAEAVAAPKVLSLVSLLAVLCYGLVPVMKKFVTDMGALPVLSSLIMHTSGLGFLLTLGNLLKIELKWEAIPSSSVLYFTSAGILYALGSVCTFKALQLAPASIVAPVWSAQPVVSFILARLSLQGIERVTFKDGIAVLLVVGGVLVLRTG